jgi:hypothetical protein
VADQNQERLFNNKNEFLEIGNRVVFERRNNESIEKITIKGKDAGLEEGILSLKMGSVIKELNLIYKKDDREWCFTINGENFVLSNLKTPDIGFIETKNDVEGFAAEKLLLFGSVFDLIDNLYKKFIKLRISGDWPNTVARIKKWINKIND